jgi:hypothetical protein
VFKILKVILKSRGENDEEWEYILQKQTHGSKLPRVLRIGVHCYDLSPILDISKRLQFQVNKCLHRCRHGE